MTIRRVHVYSRTFGEWVVFESGSFDDHVVFTDFEQAVHHGRRLAEASGGRLQAHAQDGTLVDCSGLGTATATADDSAREQRRTA